MKLCHDCSVKIGETHLPNCDWEECPFCRSQLISCGCAYELLGIDPNIEPTYSEGLTEKQNEDWDKLLKKKGLIPYGQEIRFGKK